MRSPVAGPVLGSTASDIANRTAQVIGDPALPEVLSLVKQLYVLETSRPKAGGGTSTGPIDYRAGVGLSAAVMPLKVVLYVRKNPWVVPAAVAGLLGLPLMLGFSLGRASKRVPR